MIDGETDGGIDRQRDTETENRGERDTLSLITMDSDRKEANPCGEVSVTHLS